MTGELHLAAILLAPFPHPLRLPPCSKGVKRAAYTLRSIPRIPWRWQRNRVCPGTQQNRITS